MNRLLLLVMIAVVSGCSPNIKISGTVTFSDDGSPVPAGTVVFDNGSHVAQGTIQENGRYTMGFEKAGNGVPPGTYKVTILRAYNLLPNPEDLYPPPTEQLIDLKYEDKTTSGLTITVNGSAKVYDIQVERFSQQGEK